MECFFSGERVGGDDDSVDDSVDEIFKEDCADSDGEEEDVLIDLLFFVSIGGAAES
jgi:hypothetical protein